LFFKVKDSSHELFSLFTCSKASGICNYLKFNTFADCEEKSFVKLAQRKGGIAKGLFLSGFGFNPFDIDFKLEKVSILADSFFVADGNSPILNEMKLTKIADCQNVFDKEKLPKVWKDLL
jgi:hypothetical protein